MFSHFSARRRQGQGTVCFPTTDPPSRAAAHFFSSGARDVGRCARWLGSVVGKPPLLGLCLALSVSAHALDIQFRPDAGLAVNPDALAALERAAAVWERIFDDPIVIKIDANYFPLNGGAIASTSSTLLFGDDFAEIRDAMVRDDAQEGGSIVQALPTFAQLSATLPPGRTLFDNLIVSQANLKALGFTGLEAVSGHDEDATISFNGNFDFDNRDGVNPYRLDFETTAIHEIGHALGFISIVDAIDSTLTAEFPEVSLFPLDLFRFGRGAGANPGTPEEFTSFPRELRPGRPAHFDDLVYEYEMATGANQGDGTQASHWKDFELTGEFIGIMNPTLNFGMSYGPTEADIRALDAIGWHAIPEPALGVLPLLVMLGCARWKAAR